MKAFLILITAIGFSGCTKNITGYLASTGNKVPVPEFEIYEDKATDRLMFAELRRNPDEKGNYRKDVGLDLKKSDDGKSYFILAQGQQLGEIIPLEDKKFRIKFALGTGEYTSYQPKDKIKEIPPASLEKIKKYHDERAPSVSEKATAAFVRSFDLDPRTKAHTATSNLLKDHASKLKPQIEYSKATLGQDYLMHTEFLVNATVTYPEMESVSQSWLGCDDGFKYWEAQKVCVKCSKEANGFTKRGNDIPCTQSEFFSSRVLGKAEHSQPTSKVLKIRNKPVKHQYTIVGMQAKEEDDFRFYVKKESESANGQALKSDSGSLQNAFSFTGEVTLANSQAAH